MTDSDLDPTDPLHLEDLEHFLSTERSIEPESEALLRRIAEEGFNENVRAHGKIVLATNVRRQGRRQEAERLYREGLATLRGSNSVAEMRGCVNYALTCLHARRVLEALVLSRRAEAIAVELDEPFALAVARGHMVGALLDMKEYVRARRVLEALEAGIPDLTPTRRMQAGRRAAAYRLELAMVDGDGQAGAAARAQLEKLGTGPDPRAAPWARAMAAYAAGRYTEALTEIEAFRQVEQQRDRQSYRLDLLAVSALIALGAEGAVPAAREALERIADASDDALTPGMRMGLAYQHGLILLEHAGRGADTNRAYDITGAAALQRLGEVEHFLAEQPGFLAENDDGLDELRAYRARLLDEHRALLRAFGTMADGDPDLNRFEGAAMCVCAWCESVRGPDGVWLPLEHAPKPRRLTTVTHGMCTPCRSRHQRGALQRAEEPV
ncbi:MAG: hypothetical protein QNJ90_09010 [Planctomycetota bacterium]|nr:hypothetical protein [Planctomycetota bacterium]